MEKIIRLILTGLFFCFLSSCAFEQKKPSVNYLSSIDLAGLEARKEQLKEDIRVDHSGYPQDPGKKVENLESTLIVDKKKIEKSLIADLSLDLMIETKAIFYEEKSEKSKQGFLEIEIKPEAEVIFNDSISVFLKGVFSFDTESYSTGTINRFTEKNERWLADLEEGYFCWNGERVSLRIGKQIFDWSVADTISPMDNLSARDWVSIADWKRVGIPAIDWRFDVDDYFFEVVMVPKFTASKLPKGRWQEDLPQGVSAREIIDENQVQYALRAGLNWQGVDWTASFYDGVSYNPYGLMNGATSELRYSEEKVYSLSAIGEVGGYILKGELGHYEQEKGDDFIQYVVGIRREFEGLLQLTDILSMLIQYTNEEIISKDKSILKVTDFRRDLRNSVLTRISYEKGAGSPWKIEIEGIQGISKGDYFVRPKIIYFQDDFEIEFGVQLVDGSQKSFWGKYSQANAFFVGLKYFF